MSTESTAEQTSTTEKPPTPAAAPKPKPAPEGRSSEGAVLDEQVAIKRRVRRLEAELGLEELLAADDAGEEPLDPETFDSADLFDDLAGDDDEDEEEEASA